MRFSVGEMTKEVAKEIVSWKYDAPYDFYNDEGEEESIAELLGNSYTVIYDEKKRVVGFFCTGYAAQVPIGYLFQVYIEKCLDIGIGMKPQLTGQGNGPSFFAFILSQLEKGHNHIPIRLTVAAFNKRAIHLYRRAGFEKRYVFKNGDDVEFWVMIKEDK